MTSGLLVVKESGAAGGRMRLPDPVPRGELTLRVGHQMRLHAELEVERTAGTPELLLDRGTLARLHLRPGQALRFSLDQQTLRVGPVVGILTAGLVVGGRVPGNRQMFRYVLDACRKAGLIAYVFLADGVSWSQQAVTGYQWGGGRWVSGRFPLPDVVYNRVPNRKLELSAAVSGLKHQLRQRQISYFNPRYLNKLDLHRILARVPAARSFLPWTGRVRHQADVDRALQRYGSVYLKPKDAFAGKGILRVSRGRSGFDIRYRVNDRNRRKLCRTPAELQSGLRQLMGAGTYMVQQAIELARYRGRIFDVRLLAQKNGQGVWQVSGMGVRVASRGGITTHVPNGGYIAPITEVLPVVFTDRAEQVEQRVRQLALTLAPLVEKGCGAPFGEMSMDIGIDRHGRPFFFEANSKPMKFDEDRIRAAGLRTLVEYMQYLAAGGERQ